MDIFLYQVLPILCTVLTVLLSLIWMPPMVWQVIHGIRGLLPLRKPKRREGDEHSFAVLICARNEAGVIGNLIDSIEKQEYSKDKFKIFCIADNCTDDTAAVARARGAAVLPRR
jgi:cellulose synthase/poly-beta-1,6-N-acetylglucosamine synthase-like glycosyltransferase